MSDVLNTDLVIEILKRLPVKSLLRFMSVCKSWYSLIKSPIFITTHLNHQLAISSSYDGPRYLLYRVLNYNEDNRYVVHCDDDGFSKEMELMVPNKSFIGRVGSSNGIHCLGRCSDHIILALWNPSLRKLLEIDTPYTISGDRKFSHGFGFDVVSNDYKIVSIEYMRNSMASSLETVSVSVCVYSLNCGSWRWIDASFVLPGECFLDHSVNVNGVIYWLVVISDENSSSPFSILMFNLTDENFSEIPLPKAFDGSEGRDFAYLMTVPSIGSKQYLAYFFTENCQGIYNVWVKGVDSEKESWRATLSMKNGVMVEQDPEIECARPVNLRKKGEIVVVLDDGRVASLDTKDMHRSFILNDSQDLFYAYMGTYLENLVLLR